MIKSIPCVKLNIQEPKLPRNYEDTPSAHVSRAQLPRAKTSKNIWIWGCSLSPCVKSSTSKIQDLQEFMRMLPQPMCQDLNIKEQRPQSLWKLYLNNSWFLKPILTNLTQSVFFVLIINKGFLFHLAQWYRFAQEVLYAIRLLIRPFMVKTMDRVVEDCLFFLHYIQKFESSDCSMRYDVSFCDLLCVVLWLCCVM